MKFGVSKQKLQLMLLFSIGILSYGKNLNDMIAEYEKNSYRTKINQANMKTYEIRDKLYNKGDWNELSINSSNQYQITGNNDGLTLDNTIKYGLLYYKNGYDVKNRKITTNKIGISKSLNDFFYSNVKYNKQTNDINKNIQKINNENSKNSEIRDLIDLYKNYKNKEKELEVGKISLEGKKKDYDILTKKYQLGVSSQYDYNLAKYEYETALLNYENIGKELKIYGEQFIIYSVTLPEDKKLDDLVKEELKKEDFYSLRLSEAESIKLNSDLNNIKYGKENFDYKYPVVSADAGYDFEAKGAVVGIGVTKTFKTYNDTLEDLKNEAEKLRLEYEQKKVELVSNVGQQMINYTTYQTNEEIAQKKVNITKQDYEIYAKKYEIGEDTFSNYVDKRNNYYSALVDYEKAKNELAAFTKKIKYYYK